MRITTNLPQALCFTFLSLASASGQHALPEPSSSTAGRPRQTAPSEPPSMSVAHEPAAEVSASPLLSLGFALCIAADAGPLLVAPTRAGTRRPELTVSVQGRAQGDTGVDQRWATTPSNTLENSRNLRLQGEVRARWDLSTRAYQRQALAFQRAERERIADNAESCAEIVTFLTTLRDSTHHVHCSRTGVNSTTRATWPPLDTPLDTLAKLAVITGTAPDQILTSAHQAICQELHTRVDSEDPDR